MPTLGLEYINTTYFGLFEIPGKSIQHYGPSWAFFYKKFWARMLYTGWGQLVLLELSATINMEAGRAIRRMDIGFCIRIT